MRRMLFCLALLLQANDAGAQALHKKACDFLTQADISAVLGVAVGPPGDPRNTGNTCQYSPQRSSFNLNVGYSDVPDPEAVAKFLKATDTQTYLTATPVPGLGDAAFFSHLGTATKGSLTVFVGGTMTLSLNVGTLEQLRALAQKALGESGATGFAYNSGSIVPALAKPATPSAANTSPLDQLKLDLAKKAESGDGSAALALADLYRYGNRGNNGATKPDYPAAMYWYKRASDRGVARASYELATIYQNGLAGAVNEDAAKELFGKAADVGYVPAMFPLATMYSARHDAVGQRRAIGWATKSAQENDPLGHLLMGSLWENGQLSFDDSESGRNALTEYGKAADQGNCYAMLNLGGLYFKGGHGVTQNASQSEAWYSRAESCFGKQFADMQAQAARYRALAAAGHLPVPPAPPAPVSNSSFFTRKSPTQPPEVSAAGQNLLSAIVALGALGLAYAITHPDQVPNGPAMDYTGAHNVFTGRGTYGEPCMPGTSGCTPQFPF
jgi:TPR repeat protein